MPSFVRTVCQKIVSPLAGLLALLFVAAPALSAATPVAPVLVPYTVTAIAGNTQTAVAGFGGDGGGGTSATLNGPSALAVDSAGNVYISDTANALIREVNAQTGVIKVIAGVVPSNCTGTVCTTTNSGCSDGVQAVGNPVGSRINGLVVDGFGNLYFADYNYQGVWVIFRGGARVSSFISLVDPGGVTIAGGVKPGYTYHIAGLATGDPKTGKCSGTQGSADGPANLASFSKPLQMGIDAAGNLYVQDTGNSVVRVINTQATSQTFFGVAVPAGNVGSIIGCNSKLTKPCPASVPPFGGPAGAALFSNTQAGLTTDQYGNVYELDTAKATGGIYAGVAYSGGSALASLIKLESGLSANPGSWYQVINNYAGATGLPSAVQAVLATANNLVLRPTSIAVDPSGNLYMMDYHWISVYRVDVNSQVATRINGLTGIAAGTTALPAFCSGTTGPQTTDKYGDGCPITLAKFNAGGVGYVTFDPAGNLYIADTGNNIVRKVSLNTRFPATNVGSTLPQTLQMHFDASNLPAATNPFTVVGSPEFTVNGTPACSNYTTGLDASVECYVNVTFKPALPGTRAATLHATSANGTVYPFALSGVGSGAQLAVDGAPATPLTISPLGAASALATDAQGNLYIADATNNSVLLLPAGGGAQSTLVTHLSAPQGVATDAQGNLYVSDTGNNRILKVSATVPTDVTSTAGPQPVVLTTNVKAPQGLVVDPTGTVYVADTGNSRILEISPFGELAPSGLLDYTGAQPLIKPVGVALDNQGNLYVADEGNFAGIVRITPGGGDLQPLGGSVPSPASMIDFAGYSLTPSGVAVDAAGNVYVTDYAGHTVTEIPSGSGPGGELFQLNFPGLAGPVALTLDPSGNLYVADTSTTQPSQILFENRSSLSIDFGNVYLYQNPGTAALKVTNIGNAPYAPTAPFAVASGTNAAEFTETDTCGASNFATGTLSSGLHCDLTPTFTPTAGGARSGTFSVQSGLATISMTGVGLPPQATVTLSAAAPGGLVANQTATVTLTATQTAGIKNTPAGGQVTFSYTINGVPTTLAPVTLPASGVASFNLPTLLIGRRYVINASYTGDSLDSSATAAPLTISVPGVPLTVTAGSLTYVYGSTVPVVTGTVSGILPADQATVKYTFSTAATPSSSVGAYPIVVTFSGGNYQNYGFPTVFNADGITPAVVTETKAPLTAAVANMTAPYGATNSLKYVTVYTGLVNGDTPVTSYTPASSNKLNVGTYTLVPTITIPAGGYDRFANYAATIKNGTLTITQATSAIAVLQPYATVLPTALPSSSIIFNVAQTSKVGIPTGTLTIQDVFTPLSATGYGTPVTNPKITLNLAGGSATYTPTDPTLGSHVYTIAYAGDANFLGSTPSAPVTLLVDVPDFSVTSTTTPVQVAPGVVPGGDITQTGEQAGLPETASVVIAPILGSKAVVSLTCAVPVSYMTCTLAPTSLTLNGTASQTSILSLSTPATLPLGFTAQQRSARSKIEWAFLPLALLTILPACLGRRKVRLTKLLMLLLGAGLVVGASGCGSNLVAFFTPVPTGPQQVTVTGTSGGVSRSFVVSVNVQ